MHDPAQVPGRITLTLHRGRWTTPTQVPGQTLLNTACMSSFSVAVKTINVPIKSNPMFVFVTWAITLDQHAKPEGTGIW